MTDADALFLRLAMQLAEAGRFTCAPNPPVGCVVVRKGKVLGKGWHARAGEAHAEVAALADAGGNVRGATAYVSLEPCAFEGRTPACAQTLIDAGVARVVAACLDPHPQVAGEGMRMLQRAGVAVESADWPEARTLIAGYISRIERARPLLRVKSASMLDGSTALANGESQWLTGHAARDDVQFWRARSDAIITGVGTILADDPALTVRADAYAGARPPLRVVLDSHLRTPITAQVVQDGLPTVLFHRDGDSSVYPQHVVCIQQDPRDLPAVLTRLAADGCNEALLEAGATLVGSVTEQNLWDEWICYLAPGWLGQDTRGLSNFSIERLADARRARIVEHVRVGDDLRLTLEPVASGA